MTQDEMKKAVAQAALDYVVAGSIVGVGTGSTANMFIDALASMKDDILGTVASSNVSAERLASHGIKVLNFNDVSENMVVYVDGADEFDAGKCLVKGGGGALTREKIVAAGFDKFVCIVDESKKVDVLGAFPLPIEVIPMSRNLITRAMKEMGGNPVWREGFVTDNGNDILDVHGLSITDPKALEATLNHMPGVVTNGLFAMCGADIVLMATPEGVEIL
ncbi:MAG: ribose-5-phosphate isomerase RpiA [Mariprofundaceae bacterium]|nr:ribose-5-phosphate isomerase RpiA [Mariprofundaceae bacterium]